jgi:hypothetical protein
VDVPFGSIEETFMVKLFNLEREAKLYETMLVALSALGADPKKIKDLMDEYVQVLYPEYDTASKTFVDKAQKTLDRHLGKPFILDPAPGGSIALRPESDGERD